MLENVSCETHTLVSVETKSSFCTVLLFFLQLETFSSVLPFIYNYLYFSEERRLQAFVFTTALKCLTLCSPGFPILPDPTVGFLSSAHSASQQSWAYLRQQFLPWVHESTSFPGSLTGVSPGVIVLGREFHTRSASWHGAQLLPEWLRQWRLPLAAYEFLSPCIFTHIQFCQFRGCKMIFWFQFAFPWFIMKLSIFLCIY